MTPRTVESLATKYRPLRFDDVVGQQTAVLRLQGMLKTGKIPNAILFAGPSGVGKTTLAKVFSRYLNCEKGTACGKCSNCLLTDEHPDVKELNAANTRGIDDVRALIETARFRPQKGNIRVIILDEAQQLTPQASQALLKPIEKPPAHTLYIICSMEVDKIPAALIGRCNRIDLKRITKDDMVGRLATIAKAEGHKIPTSFLEKVADLSGGQVRDSIQILDAVMQVVAASGKISDKVLGDALSAVEVTDDKVAAKALLGIYLGLVKPVHLALLDAQDYFQLGNKLLYLNTYLLDTLCIERHPMVWHTKQNLEVKKLLTSKDVKLKLSSVLTVQNGLLSMKQEMGGFALPERHLMSARLCAIALSMKGHE